MTPPIVQRSMERISEAKSWTVRNHNILFFVGGFLFDAFTLTRIDSWLDLALQTFYLSAIAFIMIQQARQDRDVWQPSPRIEKIWQYNVEALHFFYGGLLSAYVIFYFKSSTFTKSSFFLLLIIVLMFVNEMPQVRRYGSRLRLGLFALCVASYLNYLLPVLIGRMGGWVFALAICLSAFIVRLMLFRLASLDANPSRARWTLGWSPAVVLVLIMAFYSMKWIPPVPLSMQFAGVYHRVEKAEGQYLLTSPKWPWYQFWRSQSRPFLARPGDVVYLFVRVFGPRRFKDEIYLHWQHAAAGSDVFRTQDRIPLAIFGGRGEGFRGYAAKSHYQPGRWRISVETQDGRALGEVNFDLREDLNVEERQWVTVKM